MPGHREGDEAVEPEHFHIRVRYHDMPLAIVTAHDADDDEEDDPSRFVVVVRDYLERELSATDVELSVLGPSPFHGEFFARIADQPTKVTVTRVRGSPGTTHTIVHVAIK